MNKQLRCRVWTGSLWYYWGYDENGRFVNPPVVAGVDIEQASRRFTGFKDSANRDIYEGAWIEDVDKNLRRFEVIFDAKKGWGKRTFQGTELFPLFGNGQDEPEYFKIIGDEHTVGLAVKLSR